MAVAFDAVANVAPATGSSFNISITVPSGNPVLMVAIALDSTTETVTGVTWSLGSGTAVEVTTVRLSASFGSVWAIPAPTAGAGTVAVTLSGSVPYQGAAETFTGAHQTTPSPGADAVTSSTNATPQTLTPNNVAANDAAFAVGVSTLAQNPLGITPNDRFKNNTTNVNIQVGDRIGVGAVTMTMDGSGGDSCGIGVRIAEAGGGSGEDVFIRYGSMSLTDGSGLVTAAFQTDAVAATVGAGYYLWYYQNVVEDLN